MKALVKLSVLGLLVIIQSCLASITSAEEIYSVTFSEGYYPVNINTADKFGALVIVRRASCVGCPGVELGRFRGSTLPNAYWYYKDEKGNPMYKDGQIQVLFEALRLKATGADLAYFGLQSLQPILYLYDKEWPFVGGGEYSFSVKANPRFSPRALSVNEGRKIRTVNPNPTQQYNYDADGIWIHRGISYGPNKGSEGCLTIHPDDWDRFIQQFPNETMWGSARSVGVLWIVRLLGQGMEPPNYISIPVVQVPVRPLAPSILPN